MVAVSNRRGAEAGDIGPAGGLGDRQGRDLRARENFGQYPRFQRGAPGVQDRRRSDRVREERSAQPAATGTRDLLGHDQMKKDVTRRAAVLLRVTDPEKADIGCLAVEIPRESLGLVPIIDVRRDLAPDEAAHEVTELFVLATVVIGVALYVHRRLEVVIV